MITLTATMRRQLPPGNNKMGTTTTREGENDRGTLTRMMSSDNDTTHLQPHKLLHVGWIVGGTTMTTRDDGVMRRQ
jgi:hypothetical protein